VGLFGTDELLGDEIERIVPRDRRELSRALGADTAQLLLAQPGNDPSISVDELRALKGKVWFDLGIPSNAQGKAQLLALAKIVLSRVGPLL